MNSAKYMKQEEGEVRERKRMNYRIRQDGNFPKGRRSLEACVACKILHPKLLLMTPFFPFPALHVNPSTQVPSFLSFTSSPASNFNWVCRSLAGAVSFPASKDTGFVCPV